MITTRKTESAKITHINADTLAPIVQLGGGMSGANYHHNSVH